MVLERVEDTHETLFARHFCLDDAVRRQVDRRARSLLVTNASS